MCIYNTYLCIGVTIHVYVYTYTYSTDTLFLHQLRNDAKHLPHCVLIPLCICPRTPVKGGLEAHVIPCPRRFPTPRLVDKDQDASLRNIFVSCDPDGTGYCYPEELDESMWNTGLGLEVHSSMRG